MPKYYEFKVCGYFLYYTSHCIIEAMHVHASDKKMTEAGSAKGILSEHELRVIREFISEHYKEMYLKWIEKSTTGFYEG